MRIVEVGVTADSKGYACVKLTAVMDSDDDHLTSADVLLMQARNRVMGGMAGPPAAAAPPLEYELEPLPEFK